MGLDRKGGRGKSRPSRFKKRKFRGNQYTLQNIKGTIDSQTSKTKPTSSFQTQQSPTREILREAILQIKEPVVFDNLLHGSDGKNLWKFLDWSLTEFAEKLGGLKLPFRIGLNARTAEPQWDFKCKERSMTMEEFLKNVESLSQTNEWLYFDYKYMHEWFDDNPEILSSIDWQRFGFDKQGSDSTLWIGSQGAHTNCHQDSYGCNLVSQTHGRKRWILFPPDSGPRLNPTRIPYEESTVYSSFNFFCPSKDEEKSILKTDPRARMVVLEPGQVLLVPSGWWHYVESLDLSISINIWLPIAKDRQSRLGEAVVKLLVNEIGKGVISTSDKSPYASTEAVSLVQTCIDQCNEEETEDLPAEKKSRRTEWSARELAEEYPSNVSLIKVLQIKEFQKLISENRNRFSNTERPCSEERDNSDGKSTIDLSFKKTTDNLVNAICHPDVIAKVTELLLESNYS